MVKKQVALRDRNQEVLRMPPECFTDKERRSSWSFWFHSTYVHWVLVAPLLYVDNSMVPGYHKVLP